MLEFGAVTKSNPWRQGTSFGARPGGRGADFRQCLADFILNLTRSAPWQGAADCSTLFRTWGRPGLILRAFLSFRSDA